MTALARQSSAGPARTIDWTRLESVARWSEHPWFLLAATLLTALPLLLPATPPLVDLPGHLARYRVMLGGPDAEVLGQWYHFEWRIVGNLGVDLLVRLLAPAIGLEPAVKAIIASIPSLTVTGLLWLSREAHGRTSPYAIIALPLAYNFPLHFGFVNFALSAALALNALALWLMLGRLDRRGLRALLFIPLSLLLWLCHVVGWGVLGLLAFGAELERARKAGRSWVQAGACAVLACLPLAPPAILLAAWRSTDGGGETSNWGRFDLKLSWAAMILRDRWEAWDVASTAMIFVQLAQGWRDRACSRSRPLAYGAAALLLAFLLLPTTLFGSAYADMRLAPLVVMVALVAVSPGPSFGSRERVLLTVGALALFGARTAGTTLSFQLYDREWRAELAALDHLPRHARAVSFVGSTCKEQWRKSRLEHLPAFAVVRRAAFSNDQWELAGAPLLTVDAPRFGAYSNDPSQIVARTRCRQDPSRRSIAESLANLPRESFTHVWLIDAPPFDARLLSGTTLLWSEGNSALHRIGEP